jgi:N-acetylmuramoyl-L-alanine amidase
VIALATLLPPAHLPAQGRPNLRVRDGRSEWALVVSAERGYAAVPASELSRVGWRVASTGGGASLTGPGDARIEIRAGTPFFHWNGEPLQLADLPYFDESSALRVPLQLLTDFLPHRMPDTYAFDGLRMLLTVSLPTTAANGSAGTGASARPRAPPVDDGVRVVVIDAGHGGEDPGSVSRSGVQEKTVALGVALAVAEALDSLPHLEVHLLRDDDTFIPLWDRGTIATGLKGERPGVFVSVHANAFDSPARGFETYFLSDARTEHERRVAAIENAPVGHVEDGGRPTTDLDFILRELKNLDTQHWSALLAEMVQSDMGRVHPGPDRGVKQAPLAVITNALMPAVLVEVGYLSNADEARLLATTAFQRRAGRAIARAVAGFFERYPPGARGASGAGR